MRRTLWTAAVTGLLVICTINCGGGGDDNITQACNKLQSCNALSLINATTTAECVNTGNSMMNQAGTNRSQVDQAIASCLSYSDCAQFKSCLSNLIASAP